jgi:meso-butanediol dehydrogenase/(S,S)-butanediol dehydrogenase/diacetyl reductase
MNNAELGREEILSNFALEDRVALVTGAGSGMGEGIALSFAGVGAHVVIAELDPNTAEATAETIRTLGRRALSIAIDVTKSDQVESMVSKILSEFGRIDILVNNVGGIYCRRVPLLDMTVDAWDSVINLNLKGTFLCTKSVAKVMCDQKKGSIINIASGAGKWAYPDMVAYGAAKAGIINFTKAVAIYLAPHNIRVNCIAPGAIATPEAARVYKGQWRAEQTGVPLGRVGTPRDVAFAAIYLASPAADYVTGITLEVNGGQPQGRFILKQSEEIWEMDKIRYGGK